MWVLSHCPLAVLAAESPGTPSVRLMPVAASFGLLSVVVSTWDWRTQLGPVPGCSKSSANREMQLLPPSHPEPARARQPQSCGVRPANRASLEVSS